MCERKLNPAMWQSPRAEAGLPLRLYNSRWMISRDTRY